MIKRVSALILLAIILCLSSLSFAAEVTEIKITEHGLFETEVGEVKGQTDQGTDYHTIYEPKLLKAATDIPVTKGTVFGIRYDVIGSPDGDEVSLQYRIIHPTLKPPHKEPFSKNTLQQNRQIGQSVVNVYIFEEEWEMVPGKWTIQIIYQDKVMAEEGFNVYVP